MKLVLPATTRTGIGRVQTGCTSFVLQERWGDVWELNPPGPGHSGASTPADSRHHYIFRDFYGRT